MDVPDDAGVDAEGPLDPRIQLELENLNNATDEINKLEIELDEAHTAFRQLLSDSTRRLKEIANKIGGSCIEKARCYYKALDVARQAQVQCQCQAQLFQRASEIHAAAKETVALAEARFISHQHEWNFDQAWQDMLNHATIKVMDAENRKAECGREHRRRATLFHDAESKVQQLEEKHRRAIIKSRHYFEIKAQCDQMLATQKERVEYLQKGVKNAKATYARSLQALEEISNQIHQQRRELDIMTKGPREPGVGSELISPPESLSYESELEKLNLSRINSIASSEPDIEERSQDFEDVYDLKQRMEQLGTRSVDGSESNPNQWELELQASVERLNNVPVRKFNFNSVEIPETLDNLQYHQNNLNPTIDNDECKNRTKNDEVFTQVSESRENNDNKMRNFNQEFMPVKKALTRTDTTSLYQSWNSLTHNANNPSAMKLQNFSTTNFSKSLNNSLANIGNFIFKKPSSDDREMKNPEIRNSQSLVESNFKSKHFPINEKKDIPMDIKCDKPRDMTQHSYPVTPVKKKISVDTSSLEIDEFTGNLLDNVNISNNDSIQNSTVSHSDPTSHHPEPQRLKETKSAERTKSPHESTSFVSTKHITLVKSSKIAKSCENNLDKDFVDSPRPKQSNSRTSSIKELPLLSLIQKSPNSRFFKDKSCSMTDLDESKKNVNLS